MGSRTLSYTGTHSEGWNQVLVAGVLPNFSGSWSATMSCVPTPPSGTTVNLKYNWAGPSGTCYTVTPTFSGGQPGPYTWSGNVPTSPPSTYTCTDFNAQNIATGLSDPVPAGAVITLTITAAGIIDPPPPLPCAYGTRASASAPSIAIVTDALITTALTAVGAPWLAVLFAPLVWHAINTGTVCSTLPGPVHPFVTNDLLATIDQKAQWLNQLMWWSLCECVPAPSGQPGPVQPAKPSLSQPSDFPQYGPYPCTNSDICSTLVQILKRLDELNSSQTINVDSHDTVYDSHDTITTAVKDATKLAYTAGTVHSGLTGSGSLSVSNLVGVRAVVTSSPSGPVLPGNPQYLWDQGWMSVSDGAALLIERRIARASSEWFPPEMDLATTIGYWLHPGVVVDLVELAPA